MIKSSSLKNRCSVVLCLFFGTVLNFSTQQLFAQDLTVTVTGQFNQLSATDTLGIDGADLLFTLVFPETATYNNGFFPDSISLEISNAISNNGVYSPGSAFVNPFYGIDGAGDGFLGAGGSSFNLALDGDLSLNNNINILSTTALVENAVSVPFSNGSFVPPPLTPIDASFFTGTNPSSSDLFFQEPVTLGAPAGGQYGISNFSLTVSAVPEPGSLLMLSGFGVGCLAFRRRR